MLIKMNKEKGMTIVISSGEIGELKRTCDRIAVMFEGKVLEYLTLKKKMKSLV